MLIAGWILIVVGIGLAFVGGFGTVILAAAVWSLSGSIFLAGIVLVAAAQIIRAIKATSDADYIRHHETRHPAAPGADDAAIAPDERKAFWEARAQGRA